GDIVDRLKATEKELEKVRLAQLLAGAGRIAAEASDVHGVAVVAQRLDGAGGGDVRTLATDVRARLDAGRPGVVTLLGVQDGKVSVVAATNEAAREVGLSANDLVRATAPHVAGKGGGKPDMAQGGGTDAGGVDAAVEAVLAEVARVRRA